LDLARSAILRSSRAVCILTPAVEDVPEALIYRTEVLSIIGALADIVVDLHAIREELVEDGEEEEG